MPGIAVTRSLGGNGQGGESESHTEDHIEIGNGHEHSSLETANPL